MQILLSILVFLLIFSIVVFVHEFGHFSAAKRAGIKVEEFGFGMPPRIFGKKVGETVYSINWIPFGGFVRLLGEDVSKAEAKSSKRSYLNKSVRARSVVALGGIVMNFILAFLLLSFGFMIGIEPLIATTDDFLNGIRSGQIVTEPGFYVYSVSEGGSAEQAGLQVGDKIVSAFGAEADDLYAFYDSLALNTEGVFEIESEGSIVREINMTADSDGKYGFDLYSFELPRVAVYSSSDSNFLVGDVVLTIGGEQILSVKDYQSFVGDGGSVVVYRDSEVVDLGEIFSKEKISLITEVVYGSPAEIAGLQKGDKILSINGNDIYRASDVVETTSGIAGETLEYVVERDGEIVELSVGRDENGLVGVYIADIYSGSGNGVSVYETMVPTSVLEIKDAKYGFFASFAESWHEIGRLSVLTFGMLKSFVGQLFIEGTVAENISGPVGIAQMTYVFLQEGFASLIRFTALLSLGLGTFNIVPFPGLDGGRFAFLAFEGITGRKPNRKVEAMFHSVGFMLLMLLMIVVTYKDIVRIVVG
ncbi:MAG: hypothetical protein ACD_51C00231G0007 [uncultured bacterium]|nr:MAG: hypothetical protein ACD_51C00231G0007 [uncultured bacterium]OGJ48594.1 MAG: RIP metalloprotease RseP [Candidatus Peregrinibacteria bacterium RIFOXYB12_FULL_41_12]OGJ48685.1 MAG: RIP metalloprotease RseP [Candidatus Peregrinibacteria bacterium RIFOXYA2_FULL_41_18]